MIQVFTRSRKTIKSPKTSQAPEPAPDLMEALERTLAEMKGGTSKRQKQEA